MRAWLKARWVVRRVFLILLLSGPLLGQPLPTPLLDGETPAATPSPTPSAATSIVQATFRGIPLFPVRGLPEIEASDRAELLERRLERALASSNRDPEVRRTEGATLLVCGPVYLITVTHVDAESSGLDTATLAHRWRNRIDYALERVQLEESGDFYHYLLLQFGLTLLIGTLLHILVRRLTRRILSTTGFSLSVVIWLSAAVYLLWQHPQTRHMANGIYRFGVRPLVTLLVVVASSVLVTYLTGRVITHYFGQIEKQQEVNPPPSARWRQRLHMFRDVTRFVANGLIAVLALVIYFALLEVNVGAVLAGAGFLGVGLGLAAQDMLKDWMAGVNIVLEDQFGSGDYIQTGTSEGTVEAFTLRVTQLRDTNGCLITVPNSTIRVVKNMSNIWSQVDLTVPVSMSSDVRKAMEIMREVGSKLHAEQPLNVIEEPQVLGIDDISEYAVRLRLFQRVAPMQQFPVRRELLLRLKEAFEREGIHIPVQSMHVKVEQNKE